MRTPQAARARGSWESAAARVGLCAQQKVKGWGEFPMLITSGWNRTGRLCRPLKEILDGTWPFPGAQPVK